MGKRHFITILFSLFFLCIINSYGQVSKYQLNGQLEDTFSFSIPYNADIILLKNKDTIVKGNSDNKGNFQLSVKDSGSYQLFINHPDYLQYIDSSIIIKDTVTSLELIELDFKSRILDEVIIKDGFTSRINKDTIEFTADSFLIKQFSSAKELLTKIPGIQIGLNGGISYNGKPINEVSLDGIPFLTMPTDKLLNLLRGKDLNKVQFFDLKSQQSRMTGIDDNARNIGLNLTLKEEAKTGYYGKLAGGVAASKPVKWDHSGNVNSFNDTRRIMVFANISNTGATSSIGEVALPQPSSPPQGMPQTMSGGGHYDTRLLKNNKLSLNLDYNFNRNTQDVSTTSNTTNLIPGNEFKTQELSGSKENAQIHNLSIATTYLLSDNSSINLTIESNINIGNGNSQSQSESYDVDGNLLNTTTTQSNSTLHASNTLANINYQKTFNKPGRAFNLSFTSNLNKSESHIDQTSNLNFKSAALEEKIRQEKENNQNTSNYTLNLHYTEPLMKGLNLNFDFITNTSRALSNNNTYDIYKDSGNLVDSLNPLYSNKFNSKNTQIMLNTALLFQAKKIFFSLGGYISRLNWNQSDLTNNISQQKKYSNILPAVSLRFNINSHSMLNFSFGSQTSQPQLAQIQPITNNNDPLHIFIGNPDLTQSYSSNFSLNYNNSKPSTYRYFNTNASFSFTKNAISLKQYYNTDGKEVSQYYNVSGNYNGNISANYNCRLFAKMQFGINENISLAKNNSALNNQNNSTFEQLYTSNITFLYAIDTLLSINYSLSFNYSLSHSSLVENSLNKIWGTMQNLDITYDLPHGFSIASRLNLNLRPKMSQQDLISNIFLWNFSFAKNIGKQEAFTAKVFIYDILNQNKSYSIYYGPNIQSEAMSNTIGRYAMLGIVWNFTKRKHKSDAE